MHEDIQSYMNRVEAENPAMREFAWLLNSQRTGSNDFLTVDGGSLYEEIRKALARKEPSHLSRHELITQAIISAEEHLERLKALRKIIEE